MTKHTSQPGHTPGTWEARPENDYVPAQVFAGDYGRPIADVYGNSRDERAANAGLIAAAPDQRQALIEAPEMDAWEVMTLEELRESARGYCEWYHGQRKAAIDKAENCSFASRSQVGIGNI